MPFASFWQLLFLYHIYSCIGSCLQHRRQSDATTNSLVNDSDTATDNDNYKDDDDDEVLCESEERLPLRFYLPNTKCIHTQSVDGGNITDYDQLTMSTTKNIASLQSFGRPTPTPILNSKLDRGYSFPQQALQHSTLQSNRKHSGHLYQPYSFINRQRSESNMKSNPRVPSIPKTRSLLQNVATFDNSTVTLFFFVHLDSYYTFSVYFEPHRLSV